MLEQRALLIGVWTNAANGAQVRSEHPQSLEKARAISDPEDGKYLGFAAWRPGSERSWFPWLARRTIEVFETEDASLLMTLHRPWGLSRAWTVFDAEERRVGVIFRTVVWDADGQRLANVVLPKSDQPGRFVGPRGGELAALERRGDGALLLTFADALEGDPFVKMTLLGATLLLPD